MFSLWEAPLPGSRLSQRAPFPPPWPSCECRETVIETSDRPDNRVLPGGEYASPNREPSLRSCVSLVERTDLGVRRRSAIGPGLPGPLHAPTQTRFPLVGDCPGSSRWPRRLQTLFARRRSIASPHERMVRIAFSVNSANMASLLELLVFPSSSKQVKPRMQFPPRPAAYPFRVALSALADNHRSVPILTAPTCSSRPNPCTRRAEGRRNSLEIGENESQLTARLTRFSHFQPIPSSLLV